MRRKIITLASALLLSLGATSRGQQSAALQAALAPLHDGVPEVGVARLKTLLARNPPAAEQLVARRKLAEALVQMGRPAEALEMLAGPGLTKDPEAIFWRAQSLAALDRWAEALPFYEAVAGNDQSPRQHAAIFGSAQAWRALGRKDEALKALRRLENAPEWSLRAKLDIARLLLDRGELAAADHVLREAKPQRETERNEKRFLFGRLNLAQAHAEKAIEILGGLLKKPEDVSHPLLIATLCALADAHLLAKTPETGDDALEEFIDHHPDDPELSTIFAKLDELYRMERKPSTNELERWMRDPAEPRRVLAQWCFARSKLRSGNVEMAIELLTKVRDSGIRLPSLGAADLELARLHLGKDQWEAAIAAAQAARAQNSLPAFREQVEWLMAEANYRNGQLAEAGPIYEQLARESHAGSDDALFNAALCWLRLNRAAEFAADYRKISSDPTKEAVQGELLLEQGAAQAAQGKWEAAETFQKFIRDFPQSPRVSEAWVALAELAFHAPKPGLETARQDLARAREEHPTPAALERADYLQVWLEDATPAAGEAAVIAAADRFLQQHPDSHFTAEVRMKLAEAYFRREDFANAQTQFELLAQQKPDGPLTEKALFFAARSAMSSMGAESLDHALALLDQVVKLNGDLKWVARNEEAAIERRLGKNREALALYDEVLKNEAKAPEHREALCGQGDILYEMGATDPQNYRRAIELYEQLANEPGVPAHWRNQAEFKKGKALEKLNDQAGALETYYGVIEQGARPDVQHEFFWFYKAGFNAAHLLEEAKDWKSAVAVYRKLAGAGGVRSDEAKARLTQLRLEHFLWDE